MVLVTPLTRFNANATHDEHLRNATSAHCSLRPRRQVDYFLCKQLKAGRCPGVLSSCHIGFNKTKFCLAAKYLLVLILQVRTVNSGKFEADDATGLAILLESPRNVARDED